MRELVSQREHLRGLGLGGIDEQKRRAPIDEREAPKLLGPQAPPVVVEHDAARHDQHSERLDPLGELAQGVSIRSAACAASPSERPSALRITTAVPATSERVLTRPAARRPTPANSRYHACRFRQTSMVSSRSGRGQAVIVGASAVGNGQSLDRRLGEVEVVDRDVHRGRGLRATSRKPALATLPARQRREAPAELGGLRTPRARGPADQLRFDPRLARGASGSSAVHSTPQRRANSHEDRPTEQRSAHQAELDPVDVPPQPLDPAREKVAHGHEQRHGHQAGQGIGDDELHAACAQCRRTRRPASAGRSPAGRWPPTGSPSARRTSRRSAAGRA